MTPGDDRLVAAMAATWPPAATRPSGPWLLRDGQDGGKRVSAATARGPVTPDDIAALEASAREADQPALVMVRYEETTLDADLAEAGWQVIDPVVLYVAPVDAVSAPLPFASAFAAWEPLAIMRAIWAEGGIGPGRLAVMARAEGPKTALVVRANDRAAGTAFVAVSDGIAMVHAIEVRPRHRRAGAGRLLMQGAARWAERQGASHVGLAVTEANTAARGLYARMGMREAARYHYRIKELS